MLAYQLRFLKYEKPHNDIGLDRESEWVGANVRRSLIQSRR